jgi:acylphosphatase
MDRVNGADRERRSFTVTGRVQGVGFRWFTREAASRLGLTGWVANQADGSVVGEVEGSRDSIEAFLSALRRGPSSSSVDRVAYGDIEALARGGSTFEIHR